MDVDRRAVAPDEFPVERPINMASVAAEQARSRFTAQQKLDAVERELGFRRRVYVRRVADGKMTQRLADEQIAVFEAMADDYRKQAAGERLL